MIMAYSYANLFFLYFFIITNKGLKYLTLHVMSLNNIQVSQFKLNY